MNKEKRDDSDTNNPAEENADDKSKGETKNKLSRNRSLAKIFGPPAGVFGALFLLSIFSFDGNCYGFIDGKEACSLTQYVNHEMLIGLLFLGFPSALWILVATLFELVAHRKAKSE